jgi:cell division septal protein FtsQ
MLKGSSLCLCSSHLGTFWLNIEQFWPFEEISVFSNGGHLGYRTVLTDTNLKGDYLRIISAKFG